MVFIPEQLLRCSAVRIQSCHAISTCQITRLMIA